MSKHIVLSGATTSGNLTLGNYIGAIQQWGRMVNDYEAYFMVANLHSLTDYNDPKILRERTESFFAQYIALGLDPKVLLLDEPAAGVPSGEAGTIIDVIEQLGSDIALLIIEHDMDLVFRLARRITVLVQGAILVEGTPQEIAADPRVREVYLGEREHR